MTDRDLLERAIELGIRGVDLGEGGPFGALVVRNGVILAEAWNRVLIDHDPTAHAEVTAIRRACRATGSFELHGCVLYASCAPCPMCAAAAMWARVDRVVFAATTEDASEVAGFDDRPFYEQLALPPAQRAIRFEHRAVPRSREPFEHWKRRTDRRLY
jgi:tRNA(Arg) A34 adenosine deaminase TadA